MKTSIVTFCLIIVGFLGYSFSNPRLDKEKDGKITVKMITEKDGKTIVIDTTISYSGELDENAINELLKSYGIDEKGTGKACKKIVINSDDKISTENMKIVCLKGDSSLSQILNELSIDSNELSIDLKNLAIDLDQLSNDNDSVVKCCSKQIIKMNCSGKKNCKTVKTICIKSASKDVEEIMDSLNQEIKIEIGDDGAIQEYTINGEDVDPANIDSNMEIIKVEDGKKKIIVKVIVKIDDVNDSDLKKLDIPSSAKEYNNLKIEKLDFYPNPNNGKFNLTFSLPEKGKTKITVFDSNGKEVYKEVLTNFTGDYNKNIDISSEGKGLFFLNVEQGSKKLIKKLVIQ